jgi:hypothetical protein
MTTFREIFDSTAASLAKRVRHNRRRSGAAAFGSSGVVAILRYATR